MNSQEWKRKVYMLRERGKKLYCSYGKLEANARIEECKSLGEAIGECLPILGRAREERSTTWAFLQLMSNFGGRFTECDIQTYQTIIDSLNRFVVAHEDWQKVEAYAEEETETVDFELHAIAVMARRMVCRFEEKQFEIDSKLRAPPTSGQFIVSDHYRIYKYSSAFGLTQGVHFFEAVVLKCSDWGSNQEATIGWATRLWGEGYYQWKAGERLRIDEENLLQSSYDPIDDQHFIGFKGSFPSGTVLGCLLDHTQRTFAFYVNGRKVIEKLPKKCHFSSNAYYVQATGSFLYCNFGQVPFKYPPPELADCSTTDLASQLKRYTLFTNFSSMPPFDNQVEPVFTDAKQRKVKETLEQLLKEGRITMEKVAEKYAQLWKEKTFHRDTYVWRWQQAILEMENIDEGKVNEWASLVETILAVEAMVVDFFKEIPWCLFQNFLVPYSKLRAMAGDRWTMYRTLTIFFSTLLQYKLNDLIYLGRYITSSLSSFLLSAFLTTTDPSTAMFTLIGLETVKETEEEGRIENPIMQKLRSKEFTEKLKEWKGKIENSRKTTHSLAQLGLVIHHFEQSLPSFSVPPPATATPTSLSPSACSPQAKLSSDRLSLRSDFKWQSACSHLSVDNSLSLAFPFFYFEATLLTSGEMRIGWATQRWQVEGSKLGDIEYSFGYDGHTGCIWHQDVQWRVRNATKWQAGDVIGCLLDLTNQQFTFYQNGERIQTNGDIYSRVSKEIEIPFKKRIIHVYERNDSLKSITPFISGHPYTAALSLGPYQQVTVNFGHTFFRFPPKCLDFWDFQQYSEYLKVHGPNKRVKSVNIPNATNAIINIESKMTADKISMNQNAVSTNPTTEPHFSILEPTVCQVCNQQTDIRRRTLEGCPHLAFCLNCASKNITCKKCSQ